MDERIWFYISDDSDDVFIDHEYFDQMMRQPDPFLEESKEALNYDPGMNLFLFDRYSIELLEGQDAKD